MEDRRIDPYLDELFSICSEDLDRLSRWIERRGEGQSLTALARRFTRGRLRYGPLPNMVALPSSQTPALVRLWDPAKAWHEGDCAIFAGSRLGGQGRGSAPCFGEVVRTQGLGVMVRMDGQSGTQIYGTAATRGSVPAVDKWRSSVEELVEGARERGVAAYQSRAGRRSDDDAQIDYALWVYGERIFGVLLGALRQDTRFVALQGRWFLRSLAVRPAQAQLEGLAQRMLRDIQRPLTVEELAPFVSRPAIEDDAGLFGLSLALEERPELFAAVGRGPWSRWVLSQPPGGTYTAKLAAYDPETGEVLCEPGETLSDEAVARLWALELLPTVIAR
ncbi:MAG: hypothetical protein JXC32_13585 [Anaerolineae bacterium]|nr:hypothetical protein [Anaerolineae bacterium]